MFLIHPNDMMVTQARIDVGRVMVKWAVTENIWGYRAIKLSIKMDVNRVKMCSWVPFSDLLRVYLTSFLKIVIILVRGMDPAFEFAQNLTDSMVVIRTRIIQFMCRVEDPGSKMENKFVIILVLFFFSEIR